MTQQQLPFGTDPHKLVRADDPDTSVDAAFGVDSASLERAVYHAILSFGPAGCTSDQVRALPQFHGKPYSSVTARYKALLEKKYIFDTGERRKGNSGKSQRVMAATTFEPRGPTHG
jgi:hypothetical protein